MQNSTLAVIGWWLRPLLILPSSCGTSEILKTKAVISLNCLMKNQSILVRHYMSSKVSLLTIQYKFIEINVLFFFVSAYFNPTDSTKLLTTDQRNQIRVYCSYDWSKPYQIIIHPHRQFQHLTPIKVRVPFSPKLQVLLALRLSCSMLSRLQGSQRSVIEFSFVHFFF